jgi:hypothetical protein
MALVLKEVPLEFIPVGIERLEVRLEMPVQTEVLAMLMDARGGPRILTRQNATQPVQERLFVALQVGPDLVETDQHAAYIGSFKGYYRSIAQPPPEDEEEEPLPPIIKQEVYHVFEIATQP